MTLKIMAHSRAEVTGCMGMGLILGNEAWNPEAVSMSV